MGVVQVDPSTGSIDRAGEGYDIIGDIHGCHDQLVGLLHALGYRNDDGYFRHPVRKAIFVGDLIDRGPGQVGVINTVRAMHDNGTAHVVMGNHEFNAVCYATKGPDGRYLRRRKRKNRKQHRAFRQQTFGLRTLRSETIDWFKTLPLWLQIDGLRVVHACWDQAAIDGLGSPFLDEKGFIEASAKGSDTYRWVEHLCKGPEVELPEGYFFEDKDGHVRKHARFRWWLEGECTYRTMCEVPKGFDLPDVTIEEPPVQPYSHPIPVSFGHYWRKWPHADLTSRTVCVDHSAVNGGPLVAYRWSGETTLDQHNLIGVTL